MLVIAAGLLLAVAGIASLASQPVVEPQIALAFGILIAVGELVRVNLPGDRSAAPLGAAGALAYALLGDFQTSDTTISTSYGVLQVVAVTSIAILVGAVPHMAVGQSPRLESLARRVLIAGFAALLFRPLYLGDYLDGISGERDWQLPALMLAIVLFSGLVDALLAALARSGREHSPFASAARDEFGALVGIGSAIGATGVLIALAAAVMGYWALPLFALPLLVAQFSFRRYASIRATYDQTIQSLSRVTELGGYTETGADVYNLHVDSTGEWLFGVSPGIEFGGEIADASGTLYRPYIRGGVTIYDKDNMNFSANFASAPVGVTGFTVRSELDNVFADAAAGVQVLTMSGTNVKLEYEGRFGEHTMQNAGTVKVTMPY